MVRATPSHCKIFFRLPLILPYAEGDTYGTRTVITEPCRKLEDVATYLSVSVPQVYALVRSGDLPTIKIGGRGVWRVDKGGKLDGYLERLEAQTAAWAKKHPLNPATRTALIVSEPVDLVRRQLPREAEIFVP